MVLGDCQLKRLLKPRFGFGSFSESKQRFAEQDARHHPVCFLDCARGQMFDGFGWLTL